MNEFNIKNLSISYVDKERELEICHSFSESISQGEIVGLFGPNGSGKSSFLRVIAGIQRPQVGFTTFNGESIENSIVGYIPQDVGSSFFDWASIYNNIMFSLKSKDKKSIIDELWNAFGLEFDYNINPRNCSGGMLQQAAIVRAFINKPKILIADEPFSALDINVSNRIKSVFRQKIIDNSTAAILSVHNVQDFISICDRLILIPNKPFTSLKSENYNVVLKYNNQSENLLNSDEESTYKNTIEKLLNL